MPDSLFRLLRGQVPGQVVVQFTDACNATCAQCGMRVSNRFERSTLPLEEVKKSIDAAAEKGVQAISFTGGEPLLFPDALVEMINHAGKSGIQYIRTGTNGFVFRFRGDENKFKYRMEKLAETLAATELRNFWISIDSADGALHEKMRGLEGVIRGIEKALPIFHRHGLYPSANLGINRYTGGEDLDLVLTGDTKAAKEQFYTGFRQAFSRFYTFVANLGFTIVNACYPMSLEDESHAVYSASSTDRMVNFTAEEKHLIFRALKDTIPKFRSGIRIFSPTSSLHSLEKRYNGSLNRPIPCLGGIDFFFIDAKDGNTYPCGYRAWENLGKFSEFNPDTVDRKSVCTLCDWECFRDPSELFFPLTSLFTDPKRLAAKALEDPAFFRHWISDLLYYRACNYFKGRQNTEQKRLNRFV
ncbi:MAG: radical SAM protein [Desulfobacteraceae bacterium]